MKMNAEQLPVGWTFMSTGQVFASKKNAGNVYCRFPGISVLERWT